MRFTKPAWVVHKDSAKSDQSAKRLSIFSVHVHPDGSRIATGGLDAKIRIWSTKPILNLDSELSGKPPKALCTLMMHTGPVLTVRWAHSGKWLASGSDDQTVMVWDHDPSARGKVWGTDEYNVEGWKALKRLAGHSSDVTDVAWSPGDRYLASVSLDALVIIWCGYKLDMLRKLDLHQGFVKGVCWDPVGEFLATQSDDRTVKIWRTTDWTLEAEVSKPFEDSPGSTFFRRLSWSPDGAHITASNATNNKGYVFIAAVITRNTWASDISLVGHENTVEVASYNPHIFLRNAKSPISTSNICSVVALGADDRSVSVWQTKSARPLIVAKEVFERQIMDLSWSWDGLTLYAASSDGSIAVFAFEESELEGIASHEDQQLYLSKFGFTAPPLPEGYSHIAPAVTSNGTTQQQVAPVQNGFAPTNDGPEKVNILVAKKAKDKKRVGLANNAIASTTNGIPISSAGVPSSAQPKRVQLTQPTTSTSTNSFPLPSEQPFLDGPESWPRHHPADVLDMMDVDVPIDTFGASISPASVKGKRKASSATDLLDEAGGKIKPRTLGGDRPVEHHVAKRIGSWGAGSGKSKFEDRGGVSVTVGTALSSEVLPLPPLMSYLSTEVDSTGDLLEVKNNEEDGTTEIALVSGKQNQWLDYLPSPGLCVKATTSFCAVGMRDGSVNVYTQTGRKLMPTLSLDSPPSIIEGSKHSLMVLTVNGQLYSWNTKKQAANFPPVSIRPLLTQGGPNTTIVSAQVRENGVPYLTLNTSTVYAYDPSLLTFTSLSSRWFASGSDFWQQSRAARSSTTTTAAKGIVSSLEAAIGSGTREEDMRADAEKQRPSWWSVAMTLGHLEARMHAARTLESGGEYRQALLMYAKKIGDEGFRGKAEELVKELFGPVYWRPGREDNSWNPTIAGLNKRDLLKDALSVFARSKTLGRFASEWQDTLKKAMAGDDLY